MNSKIFRAWTISCCTVLVATSCGCASFSSLSASRTQHLTADSQVVAVKTRANSEFPIFRANHSECGESISGMGSQVEFGQPNILVDGVGWIFGIPEKILLWDRRAENRHVSRETAVVVQNYLQQNGLHDVKVRVNQYDPLGEWGRLIENKAVHPAWRYTFGALGTIGYTLVPGRLFGTDNYNPYTNTVSIYSDIPSIAVHEAAYAKDNRSRSYPGTYGFAQGIAGINIFHETKASKLANHWLQSQPSAALVAESDRVLPPLYGMRVGSSIGNLFSAGGGLFPVIGAVSGHAYNFSRNRQQSIAAADQEFGGVVPASYSGTAE